MAREKRTQQAYARAVRMLIEFHGKEPDQITEKELKAYFLLFRGCVCISFSGPDVRSAVLGRGGTLFDGLLSILFLIISCGSQIL
jgi:hypothetical protein